MQVGTQEDPRHEQKRNPPRDAEIWFLLSCKAQDSPVLCALQNLVSAHHILFPWEINAESEAGDAAEGCYPCFVLTCSWFLVLPGEFRARGCSGHTRRGWQSSLCCWKEEPLAGEAQGTYKKITFLNNSSQEWKGTRSSEERIKQRQTQVLHQHYKSSTSL